jgi:hypothetical protein
MFVRHESVLLSGGISSPHQVVLTRNIGDARPIAARCEPFTEPGQFPIVPGIAQPSTGASSPLPAPQENSSISVIVLNATTIPSLASDAGQVLEQQGYTIDAPGNAARMLDTSRVYYRRIGRSEAARLAEGLFQKTPYRLVRWNRSDPLLEGVSNDDVVIVLGARSAS